nr:DUF637 domain-containing protein [Providencia rettgeri]
MSSLVNQFNANKEVNLNSGRDLTINALNLTSKDKITILSGRNIILKSAPYNAIQNTNDDLQDKRYIQTNLSSDKGITIASNGALTTQGSAIKSLGDITISSGGNVRLESVKTHYRKQEGKRLEDLYRQIGTEINSGKTLTILSEGSILFQASRLVAKGTMDIAAKGGYLYAQAMEETSHYEESGKKCNKWTACITKKEVKKTRSETTNKVTEFTAGGDINLYAKDDVTLEATKINSGKNAKITSQTGKVNFKAVKNTTFEQVISNSKGFYISQRNKGYKEDTWILPVLHIGGKLTIDATKGITADIKAKNAQSLQNALNSLGQTEGTKWLAGLKDRKDVQWGLVQDAYDSWDYKNQSLNPVASALIMITVAAMTSGTASQFAAWAASGTSGTTAAVISGAAYSGMTALSSQAAVALAENQGNLSKTLNSLGKSDTVKSIITQMVISGALNGLDVKMEWNKGNPADAKLPLLSNGDWNKVAQRVAAQSVISSTVNTTIQGGSFTDNFKTALLSNIGSQINAEGAKLIGDKGDILGHSGKLLGHSIVSGISAEIAGGSAKGAIVGALAAQLAGISLNNNLIEEKDWEKSLEFDAQVNKLLGGIAGAIFVGNENGVYSGANSAEIVTKFNHQQHLQFVLGEGGVRYFQGISSLGEQMSSEGYSPEEISAAFTVYIKRNLPEGQDPAKGFILAWARLVGPYGLAPELIMDNNPLTLDSAESIISLGKLTSKKQIAQFIIAQTYFNVVKPLSLGSTGRTEAYTLKEQVAMQHAISNSKNGIEIPVVMTDKRWPGTEGWVKMSQNINGIEIHYVRNKKTGAVDDFKFK